MSRCKFVQIFTNGGNYDIKDFDFKRYPYLYLTDLKRYANHYAKKEENLIELEIDISKFLDLTSISYITDKKELLKGFYNLAKTTIPAQVQKYMQPPFWKIVRQDTDGYIKKVLLFYKYDGMIINEYNSDLGEWFKSYVLFNINPII